MPKAYNKCQWLTMSSTYLCGKVCVAEYCKIHRALLRKGSITLPCRVCGAGVMNKQKVCCRCGYMEVWYRARKAFRQECSRLAAIDVFN